jgi:hypothetical protein
METPTESPAQPAKLPRLRRRSLAVATSAVLFVLLGAILVGEPYTAAGTDRSPDSGAPPTDAASGWARSVALARELEAMLDEHGQAMLERDRAAFLAGIDPRATVYRRREARLFDAVADIPLSEWSYQFKRTTPGRVLPAARRAALGPDAVTATVELRHQIAGYDATEVRYELNLTLVKRGARWQLAADDDGPRPTTGLWDFGAVTVVKGKRSLVLGLGSRSALRRYAREADAAVPSVTKVWGRGWPQRAVVVVPENTKQMAAMLGGKAADYSRVSAVTSSVFEGSARLRSAVRVVINPATYPQFSSVGRRVVLAHEVTHVATARVSDASMPLWLTEGFADYVGYSGEDVSVRIAAKQLLSQVRADRLLLPADAEFRARTAKVAIAYRRAWLACRFIADKWGQPALIRFYKAVGASAAAAPAAVAAGLRDVLGTTPGAFRAGWQAYVEDYA